MIWVHFLYSVQSTKIWKSIKDFLKIYGVHKLQDQSAYNIRVHQEDIPHWQFTVCKIQNCWPMKNKVLASKIVHIANENKYLLFLHRTPDMPVHGSAPDIQYYNF